ncbi:methyltransferase domain-containing protein [Patescibacteria group bacterium]|nr:methyltransferase domain-containing protein [Patescibacteria group bacterium]
MAPPIDYYSIDKWSNRLKILLHREKQSLRLLIPKLKDHQTVLDAGCGEGFFLQQLSIIRPKLRLYGIDSSDYQIEEAKKNVPSATFSKCNLEQEINYEDNSFDIIIAEEIIEHLVNPDGFLAEVNRVLKKNGFLLLSTPNFCAWFNRLLFILGMQPLFYESSTKSKLVGSGWLKRFKNGSTPVGHVRLFNQAALKDLLTANGFNITSTAGAVFDSGFPKYLLLLDYIFTLYPRLSANLIILAQKK